MSTVKPRGLAYEPRTPGEKALIEAMRAMYDARRGYHRALAEVRKINRELFGAKEQKKAQLKQQLHRAIDEYREAHNRVTLARARLIELLNQHVQSGGYRPAGE